MPASLRGQEMADAPGQSPVGPGYWQTSEGLLEINPTTEYRVKNVNDPQTSARDAEYANFVLAQDGSATTKLTPGLNKAQTGDTTSSVMVPNNVGPEEIRRTMGAQGLKFDQDYFLSPGADGTHVGLMPNDWGGKVGDPAQHKQLVDSLNSLGGEAYHQPAGASSYQGGHNPGMDTEAFISRKREAEALMDNFGAAKEGGLLDRMLRSSAGGHKKAFEGMEKSSGAKPHPETKNMWEQILSNPDVDPQDTIKRLIKDGDLTRLEGQQMWEQFNNQQSQSQGLLA
ncbi:MAG: hypothetical protein ACTSRN_02580 [Alphaproteobacteria bacterium]